jgi:glycosyltransferase involved in cell wall biosynthesis
MSEPATNPAITVAMSVYDGEQFLAMAIESILAQTFEDFEFLILNDGSSDGSAAIIDHYAKGDRRVRAIHRENKGLVISLNQMIEEARAPLIARMDADDISVPTRFAKQLAFLNANPDYGVIGSWTEDIDENDAPFVLYGPDHATTHEDFIAEIGSGAMLCHPSVIMRRDAVLSVGGYHQAFLHAEDFDLWLRLATVTKLCSLPERLVRYRHWSNQVSHRYAYIQRLGAAISLVAYRERAAGRPDPTATLETLPPLSELDALFGREGIARGIRAYAVPGLLYSESALCGDGLTLMQDHIAEGGDRDGLWRTVVRLLRMGEPVRAFILAKTLLTHSRG